MELEGIWKCPKCGGAMYPGILGFRCIRFCINGDYTDEYNYDKHGAVL